MKNRFFITEGCEKKISPFIIDHYYYFSFALKDDRTKSVPWQKNVLSVCNCLLKFICLNNAQFHGAEPSILNSCKHLCSSINNIKEYWRYFRFEFRRRHAQIIVVDNDRVWRYDQPRYENILMIMMDECRRLFQHSLKWNECYGGENGQSSKSTRENIIKICKMSRLCAWYDFLPFLLTLSRTKNNVV